MHRFRLLCFMLLEFLRLSLASAWPVLVPVSAFGWSDVAVVPPVDPGGRVKGLLFSFFLFGFAQEISSYKFNRLVHGSSSAWISSSRY
jgi:hypothetical protein